MFSEGFTADSIEVQFHQLFTKLTLEIIMPSISPNKYVNQISPIDLPGMVTAAASNSVRAYIPKSQNIPYTIWMRGEEDELNMYMNAWRIFQETKDESMF